MERFDIRPGQAFLAVLGKRLKNAERSDVLVESGVVALESVETFRNHLQQECPKL